MMQCMPYQNSHRQIIQAKQHAYGCMPVSYRSTGFIILFHSFLQKSIIRAISF
jgi:hypothetical protein